MKVRSRQTSPFWKTELFSTAVHPSNCNTSASTSTHWSNTLLTKTSYKLLWLPQSSCSTNPPNSFPNKPSPKSSNLTCKSYVTLNCTQSPQKLFWCSRNSKSFLTPPPKTHNIASPVAGARSQSPKENASVTCSVSCVRKDLTTEWSSGASTVAMEGMLKSTRNGSRKIPHVRMDVSINALGHKISIEIIMTTMFGLKNRKTDWNHWVLECLTWMF